MAELDIQGVSKKGRSIWKLGYWELYFNISQPSIYEYLCPNFCISEGFESSNNGHFNEIPHFFRHSVDRYTSRYLVVLMSDLVGPVCDDGGQTTEDVVRQDGGDIECTVLYCTALYYVLVVDISQPHIHHILYCRCLHGSQCPELSNDRVWCPLLIQSRPGQQRNERHNDLYESDKTRRRKRLWFRDVAISMLTWPLCSLIILSHVNKQTIFIFNKYKQR